jgi:hypothetical protein
MLFIWSSLVKFPKTPLQISIWNKMIIENEFYDKIILK